MTSGILLLFVVDGRRGMAAPLDDAMDRKTHWEHVYATKRSDEVSWYQPEPTSSLQLIDAIGLAPDT